MGIEIIPFLLGFIVAFGLYSLGWVNDAQGIIIFGVTTIASGAGMMWLMFGRKAKR